MPDPEVNNQNPTLLLEFDLATNAFRSKIDNGEKMPMDRLLGTIELLKANLIANAQMQQMMAQQKGIVQAPAGMKL